MRSEEYAEVFLALFVQKQLDAILTLRDDISSEKQPSSIDLIYEKFMQLQPWSENLSNTIPIESAGFQINKVNILVVPCLNVFFYYIKIIIIHVFPKF